MVRLGQRARGPHGHRDHGDHVERNIRQRNTSGQTIADDLNRRKVQGHHGGRWHARQVNRVRNRLGL
jgi:hypothetical protein